MTSRFSPYTGLLLSVLLSCESLLAGLKAFSPCFPIIVIECSRSVTEKEDILYTTPNKKKPSPDMWRSNAIVVFGISRVQSDGTYSWRP